MLYVRRTQPAQLALKVRGRGSDPRNAGGGKGMDLDSPPGRQGRESRLGFSPVRPGRGSSHRTVR